MQIIYKKKYSPIPKEPLACSGLWAGNSLNLLLGKTREHTFFLVKKHICFLNALFPLKLQFAFWRSELFIFNNHSRIKIFEEGVENVFRKENTLFSLSLQFFFLRGVRRILLTKPFKRGKRCCKFFDQKTRKVI